MGKRPPPKPPISMEGNIQDKPPPPKAKAPPLPPRNDWWVQKYGTKSTNTLLPHPNLGQHPSDERSSQHESEESKQVYNLPSNHKESLKEHDMLPHSSQHSLSSQEKEKMNHSELSYHHILSSDEGTSSSSDAEFIDTRYKNSFLNNHSDRKELEREKRAEDEMWAKERQGQMKAAAIVKERQAKIEADKKLERKAKMEADQKLERKAKMEADQKLEQKAKKEQDTDVSNVIVEEIGMNAPIIDTETLEREHKIVSDRIE